MGKLDIIQNGNLASKKPGEKLDKLNENKKENKIDNNNYFNIVQTRDNHQTENQTENDMPKKEEIDGKSTYETKKAEKCNEDELLLNLKKSKCKFMEHFEIQELLGKGGESYVFKSNEKRTKKPFALKILLKNKAHDTLNELKILNKIKNKNTINYYGAFEVEKGKYDCLIMNCAKFGNLIDFNEKLIRKNYFSESILCFLSYQILSGLKYLHQCKIFHGDIKPQNILVEDTLNVQIIDYSISIDYSKLKSKKTQLPTRGTSFYMAPEVIKGDTIDVTDLNKVDLYSFGVILYYFAFGYYPFNLTKKDVKQNDKIYEKITKELIIENEDNYYSTLFIDFVKKLLDKDINKRIDINEALNHYWVKGAQILFDEKEKLFNAGTFLSYLITDHIKNFDDYIKKTN